MEDMFDLDGKVALVTGGGQGVGREAALRLAAHGALVAVNDFHEERALAVAAEIASAGGRAVGVAGDVSDFAAVKDMAQGVDAALGPVDILINNAGNAGPEAIGDLPKFWETDPTEWRRWMGTNLYGVMNCSHAVLPSMIARQTGRIVTVISDAGRIGDANYVVYSGAKSGAAGFMRGLARAVGRYSIGVNCVSLAAIETPGLAARLEDPDRRRKILGNYVLRRLGQPSDAANAILFLASAASSWVTGQTYAVNGGYAFSA